MKCFKKAKQSQLRVEYFAGLARKKKAGAGCKSSKQNIVYYTEVISVLMGGCVVCQFDLSITKELR